MFKKVICVAVIAAATSVYSQRLTETTEPYPGSQSVFSPSTPVTLGRRIVSPVAERYYSRSDGTGLAEVIRLALANSGEIKIARLEIEKARARLIQAGLRSSPTLEVEQSAGRLAGSAGDHELSIGLAIPVDVFSQRRLRMDLAKAEVVLREAEFAIKQRELTSRVIAVYTDALAALGEIEVLDDILELDTQTVRFVQIRVTEGETPPLELNLLQTEFERLRAKRELAEGMILTALTQLKFYAGLPYDRPLKLNEQMVAAQVPQLPDTSETGFAIALRSRPEVRVAELEEELARAGLRLIQSQGKPDVTAYTRYTQGRSKFDDPRGTFVQSDRSLTFGVSIGLPVFDKKQGAKAEAEIAIRQAQEKRVFAEAVIRNEVFTAFQRIEAAKRALLRLETSVIPRSQENIRTIRQVYEIGELKVTDLIAEQRKMLEADRDRREVLRERYRSQADLFIAIGADLEK
jgi:cobalt-zinc-cadmium efflux system outer membrane protein